MCVCVCGLPNDDTVVRTLPARVSRPVLVLLVVAVASLLAALAAPSVHQCGSNVLSCCNRIKVDRADMIKRVFTIALPLQ